jgi:hypothetical protein
MNFKILLPDMVKEYSPLLYSIVVLITIPFTVLAIIFFALAILICWPVLPVIAYYQQKYKLECADWDNDSNRDS